MTTNDLPSNTLESLEFEPELNYLSWKVGVENLAASKATIMASSGLLTEILNDSEWDNQTLNRSPSPGGASAHPHHHRHDECGHIRGEVRQRPAPDLA